MNKRPYRIPTLFGFKLALAALFKPMDEADCRKQRNRHAVTGKQAGHSYIRFKPCNRRSYHPEDIKAGFCAECGQYIGVTGVE